MSLAPIINDLKNIYFYENKTFWLIDCLGLRVTLKGNEGKEGLAFLLVYCCER